jgi:putative acetyltransferase
MDFQIRQLTLDDMDAAAVVLRRSFDHRLPSLAGLHTPEEDRAFFRDHLFGTCDLWGAFDNGAVGQLVGIIAFADGWVEQLYVLPEFQGRGIGCRLLGLAKSRYAGLKLWTFQQNEGARIFYERNGFAALEETDGSRNEEKAPDILYGWTG